MNLTILSDIIYLYLKKDIVVFFKPNK